MIILQNIERKSHVSIIISSDLATARPILTISTYAGFISAQMCAQTLLFSLLPSRHISMGHQYDTAKFQTSG